MQFEIIRSSQPVDYKSAYTKMQQMQAEVISGTRKSTVWFLQHKNVITAGRRALNAELVDDGNIEIHHTERGGKFTAHNPGQCVVYFIIDLNKLYNNKPDIRGFIRAIEQMLIQSLAKFDLNATTSNDNIGIWIKEGLDMQKIASIGLSVKKWVTMHGIALNVNNDLNIFNKFIPCGIKGVKMTSIEQATKKSIKVDEFENVLLNQINSYFKL